MLDLVAMVPLIPCQVVELNEESPGPALARLPQVFLVVVPLLEMFPRLGEESFKKILPADGGLRRDDVINIIIFKVGKGEGTMAPSMETGQERSLDSRMSARLLEICSKLYDAFIQMSLAPLAVQRSTWVVSSGTRQRGHRSSSWNFHLTRVLPTPQFEDACLAIQRRRAGCKAFMPAAQVSQSMAARASKENRWCRIQ